MLDSKRCMNCSNESGAPVANVQIWRHGQPDLTMRWCVPCVVAFTQELDSDVGANVAAFQINWQRG